MSSNHPLDSDFINEHINKGTSLNVFLSNGVRLGGKILEEDENCFLLTIENKVDEKQLVYKRMVATIVPQPPRK